jgi:AcrR family transcriptional regulator
MRDVAEAAGVAIGAAYYYFPSKEALVLGYYAGTQAECSARVRAVYAETDDVRARLGAAFHARLDVIASDRKLLSALFRSIGDPSSELSVFAASTRDVREESIRVLDEAIGSSPAVQALSPEARRVFVLALWSLQMGSLLYFIHDRSQGQRRTRALIDQALDLVAGLIPAAPQLAGAFAGPLAGILEGAGLLGSTQEGAPAGEAKARGRR